MKLAAIFLVAALGISSSMLAADASAATATMTEDKKQRHLRRLQDATSEEITINLIETSDLSQTNVKQVNISNVYANSLTVDAADTTIIIPDSPETTSFSLDDFISVGDLAAITTLIFFALLGSIFLALFDDNRRRQLEEHMPMIDMVRKLQPSLNPVDINAGIGRVDLLLEQLDVDGRIEAAICNAPGAASLPTASFDDIVNGYCNLGRVPGLDGAGANSLQDFEGFLPSQLLCSLLVIGTCNTGASINDFCCAGDAAIQFYSDGFFGFDDCDVDITFPFFDRKLQEGSAPTLADITEMLNSLGTNGPGTEDGPAPETGSLSLEDVIEFLIQLFFPQSFTCLSTFALFAAPCVGQICQVTPAFPFN